MVACENPLVFETPFFTSFRETLIRKGSMKLCSLNNLSSSLVFLSSLFHFTSFFLPWWSHLMRPRPWTFCRLKGIFLHTSVANFPNLSLVATTAIVDPINTKGGVARTPWSIWPLGIHTLIARTIGHFNQTFTVACRTNGYKVSNRLQSTLDIFWVGRAYSSLPQCFYPSVSATGSIFPKRIRQGKQFKNHWATRCLHSNEKLNTYDLSLIGENFNEWDGWFRWTDTNKSSRLECSGRARVLWYRT